MTDGPEFSIVCPEPHGDLTKSTIRFVDGDGNVECEIDLSDLEALADKWENHNVSEMDGARDIEKCAQELRSLLEDYQ